MGYALKTDRGAVPLTGLVDPSVLIEGGRNTIVFERDDAMRSEFLKLFSTALAPGDRGSRLRDLLCCLPRVSAGAMGYDRIFRVLILEFIDALSFDLRSIRKTCIHIAHPDGRIIPFDTFNMFYRDGLETSRLAPIREAIRRGRATFAAAVSAPQEAP
jgi:hypothetical protein